MVRDKNILRLISILEYKVGDSCWNPNSTNGNTGKVGQHIRYPVHAKVNGVERIAHKGYRIRDGFDIETMHYKFGSNHLYIGKALEKILKTIESRYILDLNYLENMYQMRGDEERKKLHDFQVSCKYNTFDECKKERDRIIRSISAFENGKKDEKEYTIKDYQFELKCLSIISEAIIREIAKKGLSKSDIITGEHAAEIESGKYKPDLYDWKQFCEAMEAKYGKGEKMIEYKVPEDQRKLSVDTMKVTKDVLDYLHAHGCETIEDFINCQNELDPEIKGKVNGFLIFGLTL